MTRPILILKNVPRENPGLIEILLKEYSLKYQIVDFDNSTVIENIENYSALIVLGGPDSANDLTLKMQNELLLIRKALQSHIPYLGICLGLQTLVKAMGGTVQKCHTNEAGFRDPENKYFKVKLTSEGRKDSLFKKLPDYLTAFQLHGETVELSPQMTLLAAGDFCKNQIVKIGKTAYGIQSHFELTNDLLESWITEDSDLQKLQAEQLRSDFETIKAEYQNTGRQLFYNFLTIAGLIKSANF
ncbi:MAG: type 1 glutamine amidotransferase [Bacteroidales bacterium]|nr:type 1 glutamine amidotransferase [Bacteroidales bacterium]